MKIAIAQLHPVKGNIARNVTMHRRYAEAAVSQRAQLIVFPELSLTGYEPSLARDLATSADDSRLRELQYVCDRHGITIAAGVPTMDERGVLISMVIFQPGHARKTYSKQLLHPDEQRYFVAGRENIGFTVAGKKVIPAICYESLRARHAQQAAGLQAAVYLASVAKPSHGIEKSRVHFPAIAKAHGMTVVMANAVGHCDNFVAEGSSAAWSRSGRLIGQLGEQEEGLLTVDEETGSYTALDGAFRPLQNEMV